MIQAFPSPIILFLDANILISAALKPNAEVAGIWQLEGVRLVTSIYIMAEVQRNLPQLSQIERLRHLMTSVEMLLFSELPELLPEIPEFLQLPTKDCHVLAAAIQAKADFLITGDKKHLGLWFGTRIAGVRIEPPSALLGFFHLRKP